MAITLHCEHCGKRIKAQDSAGGKWHQCPTCHNKVYIPSPDTNEELKIAPIDAGDLSEQERLMAETYELTQDILLEREVPNAPAENASPASRISDKELTKNIILYLRQMADGQLDQARKTADSSIAPASDRAVKILDRIALSEIPEPELADIPQQVLAGFIRDLRTKII